MEYGLRVTGKVALSYPNLLTVLILVLMEYGLRGHEDDHERRDAQLVLILVLMEYGLREERQLVRYPQGHPQVLILVLMEYGLRDGNTYAPVEGEIWVLILVLMEYGLRG